MTIEQDPRTGLPTKKTFTVQLTEEEILTINNALIEKAQALEEAEHKAGGFHFMPKHPLKTAFHETRMGMLNLGGKLMDAVDGCFGDL